MSSRQIDLKEVPGIDVIQARLLSIDPRSVRKIDLHRSARGYRAGPQCSAVIMLLSS